MSGLSHFFIGTREGGRGVAWVQFLKVIIFGRISRTEIRSPDTLFTSAISGFPGGFSGICDQGLKEFCTRVTPLPPLANVVEPHLADRMHRVRQIQNAESRQLNPLIKFTISLAFLTTHYGIFPDSAPCLPILPRYLNPKHAHTKSNANRNSKVLLNYISQFRHPESLSPKRLLPVPVHIIKHHSWSSDYPLRVSVVRCEIPLLR